MMKRRWFTLGPILAAIATASLMAGCSGFGFQTSAQPVLLLDVSDWEGETGLTEITDVRIRETAPTARELDIAGTLALTLDRDGNRRGGYTYSLDEGASYDKVLYTKGGALLEIDVTIADAAAEMVYLVRIGF